MVYTTGKGHSNTSCRYFTLFSCSIATRLGFKNLVVPLEYCEPDALADREQYWIRTLNTKLPHGLNSLFGKSYYPQTLTPSLPSESSLNSVILNPLPPSPCSSTAPPHPLTQYIPHPPQHHLISSSFTYTQHAHACIIIIFHRPRPRTLHHRTTVPYNTHTTPRSTNILATIRPYRTRIYTHLSCEASPSLYKPSFLFSHHPHAVP